MLALHSSDPVTVYLSVWARVPGFQVEDLERALYSDRSLVRMYGMRRTLWVVQSDTVPLVHNSTTKDLGERERKRTAKLVEQGGVTDDGASWLEKVIPEVLETIEEHGPMLTRDVTRQLGHLNGTIEFYNQAGKLQGSTGVLSRVILQLSMESRVVRSQPAGTWVSGQYRWASMPGWLGASIPEISSQKASAELLRRWLWSFGPGTETDLKWWTGWNLTQIQKTIEDIGAVEVELDEGTGYLLADDIDSPPQPEPWVAFLPSLDPTTMGWKERDWYLGSHGDALFDRNGNAGPTVWVDGRVAGDWAQRVDGEIVYEVLEDVGSEAKTEIEKTAASLQDWFGDTVATPRFRSAHHRALTS